MGNKKNIFIEWSRYFFGYLQLILLVFFYCLPVDLSAANLVTQSSSEAEVKTFRLPLWDFMPHPRAVIKLETTASNHDFFIPLSSRFKVSGAELRLKFTNSISLLQERSQLVVRLNNGVVAQLPLLRPVKAHVDVTIMLPYERLKKGYNQLSIGVAQHYTLDCEDPAAPELWTEIDTENSILTLQGTLQPLQPILSDFDDLVAPALGNELKYNVLLPQAAKNIQLTPSAIAVQAIGLRLQYRNARFTHNTAKLAPKSPIPKAGALPGLDVTGLERADTLFIGTVDELSPFLSNQTINEINDAYLGIFPLPENPNNFILVISGKTTEQLKQAARALSHMTFPFPDTPTSLVTSLNIPPQSNHGRRNFVKTEHKYLFRELNFKTRTVKGAGEHAMDVTIDLPPDFYPQEDKRVKLLLNFSYGAKMRDDTVMNIELNGIHEKVIALSDQNGAVLQEYEILIPFRSFRPGKNTLRFEPALVPKIGGECIAVNDHNLRFTLFDTSSIEFPHASSYAAQPDLKLFADTLFPYSYSSSNKSPIAVSILSSDNETIAATWTLLSKLAQINDSLINAEYFNKLPIDDRQLIVLSPFDKINAELYKTAPLTLSKTLQLNKFPYPSGFVPVGEERSVSIFEPILGLFGEHDIEDGVAKKPPVHITQTSLPIQHGLVTAFQSPFAANRTVTLFAAETPKKLHKHLDLLVTPLMWSQLDGDIALWNKKEDPMKTQLAEKQFYVGSASLGDKLAFHLSTNPWMLITGVFILILLLAWLTHILLYRRFVRRHGRDVRVED